MKNLDQIFRYTSDYSFPDEDWTKVLEYCRKRFKGGKIHKSRLKNSPSSSFDQFTEWVENGWEYGDMVSYGKTMGVLGKNITSEHPEMVAYLDYEGNLILNTMPVQEPERLLPLEGERKQQLTKILHDNNVCFHVRSGKMCELYTPEKYFYVVADDGDDSDPDVGMYLESEGSRHHFLAFLKNNRLQMDCWEDFEYTPLKKASEKDVKRLHSATSKAGFVFNERAKAFVKAPKKGLNNVYWYLNDRFEIVMDRDNGEKIHATRYGVGNYFTDGTQAMLFMKEIKKMRGKA